MNAGLKKVSWRMLAITVLGFALIAAGSFGAGFALHATATAHPDATQHGTINPGKTPLHFTRMAQVDWATMPKVTQSTSASAHGKQVATDLDRMTPSQRAAYINKLKSGAVKAPFAPAQPLPQGARGTNVPGPNFDCNNYQSLPCAPYGFNGQNSTVSGGWYPPDEALAANSSQVMEGNNNVFSVYSFTGTQIYGPTSSFTFFAPLLHSGDVLSDPQMFWDASRIHFIIVEIEIGSNGSGGTQDYYDIAVSTGQNVTLTSAHFYEYQFNANVNVGGTANWCDYPTLGSDYWGLWLDCVAFSQASSSFLGNAVFALDKTNLYKDASTPVDFWTQIPLGSQASNAPAYRLSSAVEDGTPDAEFLIATDAGYGGPFTEMTTVAFTDTAALNAGKLPAATFVIDSLPVSYTDGVGAAQPGTSDLLYQGYGTKMVEYKAGNLYFALTTAVNSGASDGVYWAETEPQLSGLNPSSPQSQVVEPSIIKQAAIWSYGSGAYAFMPTFEGSSEDDAVLVFNYTNINSGSTTYPSIVYTGRRATDPLSTMGDGGQSNYVPGAIGSNPGSGGGGTSPGRWGDYSGCALALNLTSRGTIFCGGEYGGPDSSAGGSGWDTYIYGLRVE